MIEPLIKEIHFLLLEGGGGDTLARHCRNEPNTQIAYLGNNYNAPNTNTLVLNFVLYYLGDDGTCEIK